MLPKLAGCGVTAKEDFGSRGSPVEGAAEFAGSRSQIAGAEASTVGKAVAALYPGPEAAIGKAVMGFGRVEVGGELTLGNVGYEADVGSGGVHWLVHIESGQMATIPRASEQRR
jgi:hypothetical protein